MKYNRYLGGLHVIKQHIGAHRCEVEGKGGRKENLSEIKVCKVWRTFFLYPFILLPLDGNILQPMAI